MLGLSSLLPPLRKGKPRSLQYKLEPAEQFQYLFNYYIHIKHLRVDQYEILRKTDPAISDAEYLLPSQMNSQIPQLFKEGNPDIRNK